MIQIRLFIRHLLIQSGNSIATPHAILYASLITFQISVTARFVSAFTIALRYAALERTSSMGFAVSIAAIATDAILFGVIEDSDHFMTLRRISSK